ncbi:DUF2141 domain-containing protein [Synechocystis sp. PCC 7509]|uniref:DUF2141 domain-containing protein n=1 Tax=Synechocystis sp. PCC 7509 TaxID=927677 RepID=UPI0002AC1A31|nr:DUF2141 domain-containing protein [Synechocystis sp. PCC 7509]
MNKFNVFFLATLSSLIPFSAQAQPTAKLTVVIDGLRHQTGQVCLRIYSNEQGFPGSAKGMVQSGCTKITGNSATKDFYGLKPGNYAVSLYADKNSDSKLNTNFLGIPSEGFGISNNPKVKTRAPKFKEASFNLSQNKTILITMQYLFK